MPVYDVDSIRSAPREVPLSVRARLCFGGAFGLIGWIFMASGLGFVCALMLLTEPSQGFMLAVMDTATTEGVVTGWSETSASVDEEPVIATVFDYAVDGVEYTGASFAVDAALEPGARVKVEYVVSDPRASVVDGMMATEMPWWVLILVSLFPLIGASFALSRLRTGLRQVRVLRHGRATRGRAIGHEPTGVTVNEEPQIAVTFEFYDHLEQRHEVVAKTLDPDELLDEPEEGVLYLPDDPGQAFVIDSDTEAVTFDPLGRIESLGVGAVLKALAAPIVTGVIVAIGFVFG